MWLLGTKPKSSAKATSAFKALGHLSSPSLVFEIGSHYVALTHLALAI